MPLAPKKENKKICSLCNNSFICKVEDIENCACNSIQLKDAEREYLANFKDCICINCLKSLAKQEDLHPIL